ncbi:MAG: DUF134 domain-containing protein [Clostridiales bacterium]|nr:DUF134 domain-containing protein [Clostridiales bacterium]
MSRPVKPRKIKNMPIYNYFKPIGIPYVDLKEVELKLEELEAMRLKDIENLNQVECATRMNVSRQTFQLIIDEARHKVADALYNGKAIKIEGGNYTLNICTYQCKNCGEVYQVPYEKVVHFCPNCGSVNTDCIGGSKFCSKQCIKSKARKSKPE